MRENIEHLYENILIDRGFMPVNPNGNFNSCGQTYELSKELGEGFYWIYSVSNLYDIKIHDFSFYQDYLLECQLPECMSISYYQSIAGHELNPYRRINANCIKTFIGGEKTYKALMHKRIPIRSVGIEILPAYYTHYLKEKYPDDYSDPYDAFISIDETYHFPEMLLLLNQVAEYRGTGISAKMFYEAKVNEAVSLVMEHSYKHSKEYRHVSDTDEKQIYCVSSYIKDHAAYPLTLDQLSKIACMGQTKLKKIFKIIYGCTITEFIQQTRMENAEFMLSHTDLPIAQIGETIGYTNPSRFAELFKRNVGVLPGEYRKMMKV
ncbi:AraC family transcriptional regulator [Anaerocolumna sp. AGMB13025]|uniref:helix-turn-helix transcriptional regulator n=1 Tax=Anaerocolumna sp. AGMB13025 TaxID=3039116 RepID=UPI00241EDED2|nr:AraC family transcriptional regulator [Anaerocolumna sp. AGMB13025]WFR58657.1 AraC family transcriptional regulator [Anaerocolumna sp. AGMB13025]